MASGEVLDPPSREGVSGSNFDHMMDSPMNTQNTSRSPWLLSVTTMSSASSVVKPYEAVGGLNGAILDVWSCGFWYEVEGWALWSVPRPRTESRWSVEAIE